jgi:parafibromin
MASTDDPLLLLRQAIAAGSKIIPTTSADSSEEAPLSKATHLIFTQPTRIAIPIDTPTRFTSAEGKAVDVRSIYFAWLNRDFAIPEYNAVATKLNEEMAGSTAVHMFAFVERLVLFTFLEGAQEESEFIKPLPGDKGAATGTGAAAAVKAAPAVSGRAGRGTLDPRLAQIYNGERRMGDRNTVLRGIKPTVSRQPLPLFDCMV